MNNRHTAIPRCKINGLPLRRAYTIVRGIKWILSPIHNTISPDEIQEAERRLNEIMAAEGVSILERAKTIFEN